MQRAAVYEVLARVLSAAMREPYRDLVTRAGAPPTVSEAIVGGDAVAIELRVSWLNRDAGILRLTAQGNGPSCWKLERLEESVSVAPPEGVGPARHVGESQSAGTWEGRSVPESDWNALSAEVRLLRNCGRVHLIRLPATEGLPTRDAADEAARALGLKPQGGEWIVVDATVATSIAARVLARDLAYDSDVMSYADAHRLAQAITMQAGEGAVFLTNATWLVDGPDVRLSSWNPLSEATFDTGIACVGPDAVVMLWVEDED